MYDTFYKIQSFLENHHTQVSFFALLPVWFDKEEYEYLNNTCEKKEILYNKMLQIVNDNDNIINVLKRSKYSIKNYIYCRGSIRFINIEKKPIREDFENNQNVVIFSNTLKEIGLDIIKSLPEAAKITK